jgi:hypothetical protein
MPPDKKKKVGCHVGLELLVNASFLLRPTIHDRLLGLHDHDDVGDARSSIWGSNALDILNERYARGEIIKPNTKNDGACCARPKDSASADRH